MDFHAILTEALARIGTLRDKAYDEYMSYSQDRPEFDGAYQVWQDLHRAKEELERTRYGIDNNLF